MRRAARALALAASALALAAAPPAVADEPPGASAPRAAGRGVAVVALGAGAGDAARALARAVYADAALRPPIDEATAQVLAGAAPRDDAGPRIREQASLRAALAPDPANPATRRALESLAAELGARAVAAVFVAPDGGARARVVLAGSAEPSPVELVAHADAGAAPTWPSAVPALLLVVPGGPGAVAAAAPAPASPPGAAPTSPRARGSAAAPARPVSSPVLPREPASRGDGDAFYERPWFWAALGAFAAAGLTALVVSQVASGDEGSDTVRFRATIPEASVTFP